jgi:rhodanese-related sulfurtransferase
MSQIEIRPEMTMQEVLEAAPAAQRALFQRYHVGGCSSCGFQPTDTLSQVAKDHNILDVNDMVRTIVTAQELDQKIQVEAATVKAWLDADEDFSFIDVRTPEEWEQSRIEQAELLDYNQSEKYMGLPKESKIVFACRTGDRSLDVASYFIGHGFTQVFSMRGGLLAWSDEVDASVTKY